MTLGGRRPGAPGRVSPIRRETGASMEERLQKYMARCGVDSRRKCEELIARGLVEVNGAVVREPGVKIDPMRDRVKVDGRVLREERAAHLLHYKTRGVTTTVSDDLGRKTVMDCLPPGVKERVYPVGRLDRDSEGLLILTNDGALAHYLTHPAFGVEKTYRVVAEGRIPPETLEALAAKGMRLGPVLVKPSRVELVRHDNDNTVVMISVAEGINREVRRIFAALGHEVKRLLRVKVGPLTLEGMKRGATRTLTPRELAQLKKGMDGADVSEAEAEYGPGTAKSRRPKGPRGRSRQDKEMLRGKPDPAQAKPKRPPVKFKGLAKAAEPAYRGSGSGKRGPGTVRGSDGAEDRRSGGQRESGRRDAPSFRGKPGPARTQAKRPSVAFKASADSFKPAARNSEGGKRGPGSVRGPGGAENRRPRGTGGIKEFARGGSGKRGDFKGRNERPAATNDATKRSAPRSSGAKRPPVKTLKRVARHPLGPSRRRSSDD